MLQDIEHMYVLKYIENIYESKYIENMRNAEQNQYTNLNSNHAGGWCHQEQPVVGCEDLVEGVHNHDGRNQ